MRKITYLSTLFLLISLTVSSQNISLSENFDNGFPATWQQSGVSISKNSYAAMGSGAYMITPPVDKPQLITFNHRGSGNNKVLTVEKSTDNGTSWQNIGTVSVSSASAFGSSGFSVGEPGTLNVIIRFTCASATIFVDNVIVTSSNIADEPAIQSGLTASEVTGTSMKINFTGGDGENHLLAYSKEQAVTWIPEDGTTYRNLPKAIDTKTVIAYYGNDDNVLIDGLEAGETYHFAVFECNGENETCNYLTSNPGVLQQNTATVPGISVKPSSISFGQIKAGTDSKRSFTLSAKYLEPASGNIILTSNDNFKLSATSTGEFSATLSLPYTDGLLPEQNIYVQFLPSELTDYSYSVSIEGGSAQTQILLSGTGSDTDRKIYYLSPGGNDQDEGSFDAPWFTLGKAIGEVKPGDIVYVRGGEYLYPGITFRINESHSGEEGKRIGVYAYEDEQPVFNFDTPIGTSEGDKNIRGIVHKGNYWHFYGIHFTKARDNGVKLEGSHNIYERCTFSYCGDTGIQLGFGHSFSDSHPGVSKNDGSYCSYNYIIDCDSYRNYDWQAGGGNADGFACKMHNGRENWFIRCRAWENSDDAWDLYETDFPVYIIDCWAWRSAKEGDHPKLGNGNGIKLGGNGTGGSSRGKHEVWNSVAFNCDKTGSVKGFDQNSHGDGVKVVNCLAFGNGYDFMFEKSSNDCEYYNNVCFGRIEIKSGAIDSNNAMLSTTDKAWTNIITNDFSYSDYVSLTEEDAKAPREEDGSIPARFARLKEGSDLIGKAKTGMIAPLPQGIGEEDIFGSALKPRVANKDLGPFDLNPEERTLTYVNNSSGYNVAVYPNPVRINAEIRLMPVKESRISVSVIDLQGRQMLYLGTHLISGGIEYNIPVNTESLNPGLYLVSIDNGEERTQVKMIVVK